jgi:hypothetical protein
MHRAATLDFGDDALGVEPIPEPGHMLRRVGGADRIQRIQRLIHVARSSPVAGVR